MRSVAPPRIFLGSGRLTLCLTIHRILILHLGGHNSSHYTAFICAHCTDSFELFTLLLKLVLEMKKFTFREYRRPPNGTSAYLRGIVYKVFSAEWHYKLVVSVLHFYNRGGFYMSRLLSVFKFFLLVWVFGLTG